MQKTKYFIVIAMIVGLITFIFVVYSAFIKSSDSDNDATQNQDVEEYRKYSKNLSQEFVLDSTEFRVIRFIFEPNDDKTALTVNVLIKNISDSQQILKPEDFKLLSEDKKIYLPAVESKTLEPNTKLFLTLSYSLPARNLPYLAYFLNILKGNDKAIISISKSYRSEG